MPAKIKNRSGKQRKRHSQVPKGVSRHSFNKVYWPYIPLVLLISLLASIGIKTGVLTSGLRHPGGEVLAYSTSMEPQKLLADSNAARSNSHQTLLSLNSELQRAAQAKAQDMASRDYWSHETPEGSPPWVFFSNVGYHYQKAGENLAAGFDNEQAAINAWLASPAHRHNLLDPAYRDVGFGIANLADYKAAGGGPMTIVVAFYGAPIGSVDTSVLISSASPTAYTSSTSPQVKGGISQRASAGQIGFASWHLYSLVPSGILAVMFLAIGIWAGRHALQFRRLFVKGEKLVFNHPLVDVGLLIVAGLAFLLNQTAGFIK